MSQPLLSVDGLDVVYHARAGRLAALSDVSLRLDRGEILGVVGESGCGKSTLSAALLRLLASNGEITGGRIELNGRDVVTMSGRELRAMRGQEVAMIFQDPLTSLNPTFTIGAQLVATQKAHRDADRRGSSKLRQRAIDMLTQVGMPDPHERIDYYPHQFSGGMRQRIMIAMALLGRPDLLIADEATSALDVTLQAQILELLRQLRHDHGTAMIFISHDLGVISEICDRVVVMYAGRAVEQGDVESILTAPQHPYTQALVASVPSRDRRGERLATISGLVPSLAALPTGCTFADRCPHVQPVCRERVPDYLGLGSRNVRCLIYDTSSAYDHEAVPADAVAAAASDVSARSREVSKTDVLVRLQGVETYFHDRQTIVKRLLGREVGAVRGVDGVDLDIRRGEIVGLVGESGSGKTTLGKTILGLVPATGGQIDYDGQDLLAMGPDQVRALRRRAQMIFQDAHASLSPRLRVSQLVTEPYLIHGIPAEQRTSAVDLLEMVRLSREQVDKYPHELSGGQARRVGIARALALRPEFIIADEPCAGLDVSAAASVLNLMNDLAAELGLTYLIITHDLNTVGYLADRVALMYLGRLVETGPPERIFEAPAHPYTHGLLDSIAVPGAQRSQDRPRLLLAGEIPSPKNPPPGCRFHTRCRYAHGRSLVESPELEAVSERHEVACHHWRDIAEDPEAAARTAAGASDDASQVSPV